jgi:hypothetical protein
VRWGVSEELLDIYSYRNNREKQKDCGHHTFEGLQHRLLLYPLRPDILASLEEGILQILSTTHLLDLLEVLNSCESKREQDSLDLTDYVLCQKTLINTKEETGKLYYKIQLEICSTLPNIPTFQDKSSRESYSLKMLST